MSGAALLTNSLLDRAFAASYAAHDCANTRLYGEEIIGRLSGDTVWSETDFPFWAGMRNVPLDCPDKTDYALAIIAAIFLIYLVWDSKK